MIVGRLKHKGKAKVRGGVGRISYYQYFFIIILSKIKKQFNVSNLPKQSEFLLLATAFK
jgi:hypothetical protein